MISAILLPLILAGSDAKPSCPTKERIASAAAEAAVKKDAFDALNRKRVQSLDRKAQLDYMTELTAAMHAANDAGRRHRVLVLEEEACLRAQERAKQETREQAERDARARREAEAIAAAEEAHRKELELFERWETENPKLMRAVLSAHLCRHKETERAALGALREEREKTKIAGVENRLTLLHIQETTHAARKLVSAYQKQLQLQGLKPLPCTNKEVQFLILCAYEEHDECRREEIARVARFVRYWDWDVDEVD